LLGHTHCSTCPHGASARLWLLIVAFVACNSEPFDRAKLREPRRDEAARREPAIVDTDSSSHCRCQLDQVPARPQDRDFDQAVVDTILDCARKCADSVDGSCEVLDQVVRVVCTDVDAAVATIAATTAITATAAGRAALPRADCKARATAASIVPRSV